MKFRHLHSHDVTPDKRLVFNFIGEDNQKYSFSVDASTASLMATALIAAAPHLPDGPRPRFALSSVAPAVGENMTPTLVFNLTGNLSILLELPGDKPAEIIAAIDELKAATQPRPGRH
jgi:hypothetical protein